MRILIVEDEAELRQALASALISERHAVDQAADGPTAAQLVAAHAYDLIILDWSIPPPTGIELLRRWRRAGLETSVLMLTGHRSVNERVDGLDSGADDYLAKPFAFAELHARVRTLLRRRERPMVGPLAAGDLELDPRAHEVTLAGVPLQLSPKEYGLLHYLLTRRGEVISRTELAEHVWDRSFDPKSNVIDVLVSRLRKKIDGERPDRLLRTVPGAGYVIRAQRS